MCGLWGSFSDGKLTAPDFQRASTLAVLSELRGMDSSGVVVLAEKDRKLVATHDKDIVTASQLLYGNAKVTNAFKTTDVFAFFGHSRAATVGDITKANAHPFKTGHILGMHNGTVSKLGDDTKTDSQAIFEMLAEDGLEKTLGEIKYGAYVLVWVDYQDCSLNIIRNKERPLNLVKCSSGAYFWCSEWDMMEFMKKRFSSANYEAVIWPKENELYRFDLLTRELTTKEVKPKTIYSSYSYKPSVPIITVPPSGKTYFEKKAEENKKKRDEEAEVVMTKAEEEKLLAGLSRKQKRRLRQEWAVKRKAEKLAKQKEPTTTLGEPPVYRGFRGRPMTARTANELLAKGCQISGEICKLEDKVFWFTQDCYISEETVKGGALQAYGIKEGTTAFYKPEGL
jgi:glucosamine 6-phosphate synthetase-like amidotransferase/phosphosugar isomerase protein